MTRRAFDLATAQRRSVRAVRLDADSTCAVVEQIAEEAPIALVYNGVPHVVVMATPIDLENLALGFSLTEAVIESASELGVIESASVRYSLRLLSVRLSSSLSRGSSL